MVRQYVMGTLLGRYDMGGVSRPSMGTTGMDRPTDMGTAIMRLTMGTGCLNMDSTTVGTSADYMRTTRRMDDTPIGVHTMDTSTATDHTRFGDGREPTGPHRRCNSRGWLLASYNKHGLRLRGTGEPCAAAT